MGGSHVLDRGRAVIRPLSFSIKPLLMKLSFGALLLLSPGCLRVGSVAHVRRKAPAREKKAYDTSVRSFSPDGSIYQVEYAVQAAEKGGLTIGVQTDQGLVLAAQGRRRSSLLKSASVSKIAEIDVRMCCAMSGLLPDGRLLLDHARTWVQEHRFEFDEAPSVEAVAAQLSRLALKFNGYDKDGRAGNGREDEDGGVAMSRPVGVALLMAGIDHGNRPVLYHLDPSGAYVQWRARAIGEKGAAAEAKLEKAGPFEVMTVRRAMAVVLEVLKETLQDDFSVDRLEMACVDMRACGTGSDGNGGGNTGGAGGDLLGAAGGHSSSSNSSNSKGGGAAAVGTEPSSDAKGSSANGADSAAPEGDAGSDNSVRSNSIRKRSRSEGDDGGDGVLEAGSRDIGDGSSSSSGAGRPAAADAFVPRYGYFRRVSKSEMEELLADGSASGDSAAGATGGRSAE